MGGKVYKFCMLSEWCCLQVERHQIEHDLTNAAVTNDPERVKKLINIFDDPYEAVKDAHAIVVLTEWDEFKVSCDQCEYLHWW